MPNQSKPSIPFAAQAVPFDELLAAGKISADYVSSEYVAQQFVERLVHYILSVPAGSYTMAQLSHLLEQLDPRAQVFSSNDSKKPVPRASRTLRRSITVS